MSEYEAEVVPALDLANVIVSLEGPTFHDRRAVWEGVMRNAFVRIPGLSFPVQVGTCLPALPISTGLCGIPRRPKAADGTGAVRQ